MLHPISPSFIPQIHLPSTGEEDEPEEEEEECDDQTTILQPLETGLLTLSSLPKSHWSNLLNLDTIKVIIIIFILYFINLFYLGA